MFTGSRKATSTRLLVLLKVSCVPTTAKIAQHAAEDEDPFAIVLPVAMGANIGGVIVSAIACGVFIATIGMVK